MDELKKLRERYFLDSFRSLYADFPRGKIIPSESPDFIVQYRQRRKIGIEITEAYPFDIQSDKSEYHMVSLTLNDVISCILQKDKRLPIYQKQWLQEIWLVVVLDSTGFKGISIPFDHYLLGNLETGFDKIFLLLEPEKQLHELLRESQ